MSIVSNFQPNELMASAQSRAFRLKMVRKATKLSRKAFALKYQIALGTLQNWETARFGGLTEKGAKRMIGCFKEEQIICDFKWLMTGDGLEPDFSMIFEPEQQAATPEISHEDEQAFCQQDLDFFCQANKNAIFHVINDDSVEPYFHAGETVAGTMCFGEDIKQCVHQLSIVRTIQGQQYVCLLKESDTPHCYNIIPVNPFSAVEYHHRVRVSLSCAAVIRWSRRENC